MLVIVTMDIVIFLLLYNMANLRGSPLAAYKNPNEIRISKLLILFCLFLVLGRRKAKHLVYFVLLVDDSLSN